MKKFLNEFKTFISRGNVMDMAIGVVIATAFGKISASLVADIIMPLIGCLIGGVDLATLNITLKPAVMDGETVVSEAVVLGLGTDHDHRFPAHCVRRISGRQGHEYGKGEAGKARRAGA